MVLVGLLVFGIGLYFMNLQFGIFGSDNYDFSTSNGLRIEKLELKHGSMTINRTSDLVLFETEYDVLFDGTTYYNKEIEYGENDFLIIYDETYYYQFRQFKFHHRANHDYNFNVSKSDTGLYVNILIEGIDGMNFTREMNLISSAENLKCNVPADKAGHVYNMMELVD